MEDMTERAPWDHDLNIKPGDLIAVQCGDQLRTMRVGEVTTSDEPITPRPPMPPWWRPFARRKWRRAPVGPTLPVVRMKADDPFWHTEQSIQSLRDAMWPHGRSYDRWPDAERARRQSTD